MRIGIVFPQTEFGHEPASLQEFAQTAEELGFNHILAYEHVLGADPTRYHLSGPYRYHHAFLEPFVVFAYMAAVTRKIEFTTGILILPQRQTALVAKQSATLDVISNGRLRLGIGIGWNQVEYQVLDQNFHNRGKRSGEQVEVLRQLWSQPLVEFEGRWHHIHAAGINPRPVKGNIPIWFGGDAEAVLRRVVQLGDGWMPNNRDPETIRASISSMKTFCEESGRDPSEIGIETRLPYGDGDPQEWLNSVSRWRTLGATHLSFNTMNLGFTHPQDHLNAMHRIAQELDLA